MKILKVVFPLVGFFVFSGTLLAYNEDGIKGAVLKCATLRDRQMQSSEPSRIDRPSSIILQSTSELV